MCRRPRQRRLCTCRPSEPEQPPSAEWTPQRTAALPLACSGASCSQPHSTTLRRVVPRCTTVGAAATAAPIGAPSVATIPARRSAGRQWHPWQRRQWRPLRGQRASTRCVRRDRCTLTVSACSTLPRPSPRGGTSGQRTSCEGSEAHTYLTDGSSTPPRGGRCGLVRPLHAWSACVQSSERHVRDPGVTSSGNLLCGSVCARLYISDGSELYM